MRAVTLSAAFVPLVDAAPWIIARELGFAATEGIELDLVRAPSWSSVRDMLAFGRVDAAHLLSVMPVAGALGLGAQSSPVDALAVTSLNGNVIGVSQTLADRLRQRGHAFDWADAAGAGRALAGLGLKTLRVGVPFPFSMHTELLHYWLGATPHAPAVQVTTVPPPLMARALADGEIDAFCVGEPWGSIAVEHGVGTLLLPGSAIWSAAPEKVLGVRRDWAESEPALTDRLIRSLWRAGHWLAQPDKRWMAAEILSRPAYLDVPAEIIDRSLDGRLVIDPAGTQRAHPQFLRFHSQTAGFPWRSQAAWIGAQLAERVGLPRVDGAESAAGVFRSDVYRRALRALGADLPRASVKIEGALADVQTLGAEAGWLKIGPDSFFDGRLFDLNAVAR